MRGSITQRSKGSWTITYDLPRGSDGKRRQKRESIRGTKREAELLLTKRLQEVQEGGPTVSKGVTVAEYVEQFLAEIAPLTATSPNTMRGYRNYLLKYVVPRLGSVELAQLTALQIQKLYSDLLTDGRTKKQGGLSHQSIHHCHVILRGALKQAVNLGFIRQNPCDLVRAPSLEKQVVQSLTVEEVAHLLEVTRGTGLEIPVHLAVGAGLRRGEIIALKWEDVDLDRGQLRVRDAIVTEDGRLIEKSPKTRSGFRAVPLPAFVVAALKAHANNLKSDALWPGCRQQGLVVAGPDGGYVRPNSLSRRITQLLRDLRMKGATLHSLRHTYASLLIADGENLKVVSELLGHSRVGVTLDTYTHLQFDQHRRAAGRFDEIMSRVDDLQDVSRKLDVEQNGNGRSGSQNGATVVTREPILGHS